VLSQERISEGKGARHAPPSKRELSKIRKLDSPRQLRYCDRGARTVADMVYLDMPTEKNFKRVAVPFSKDVLEKIKARAQIEDRSVGRTVAIVVERALREDAKREAKGK